MAFGLRIAVSTKHALHLVTIGLGAAAVGFLIGRLFHTVGG